MADESISIEEKLARAEEKLARAEEKLARAEETMARAEETMAEFNSALVEIKKTLECVQYGHAYGAEKRAEGMYLTITCNVCGRCKRY